MINMLQNSKIIYFLTHEIRHKVMLRGKVERGNGSII